MTLPLVPALVGARIRRRLAGAVLVLLLLAAPRISASVAEDDPFSATVRVDATAETVAAARDLARIDGQRRALGEIVDRLSGGGGNAKLPRLDDEAITNLVTSFEVANEQMSAVRYIADYTFHFRRTAVERMLHTAGLAVAAPEGKPIVVLPVYRNGPRPVLWEDPNPWREAWSQLPANGPMRLVVPLGDAADIAAIDAEKALSGDAEALAAIARQNDGDDAIVALAAARGPGDSPGDLDITVRRYHQGQLADSHFTPLAANPGESGENLLRRAVSAVALDIESGWKKAPPPYQQQGSLTAIVPITGLDDWLQLRERLAALPTVAKIELTALSREEATIEIQYFGDVNQLKASLAGIGLDLVRGEPLWRIGRLARSGGPGSP